MPVDQPQKSAGEAPAEVFTRQVRAALGAAALGLLAVGVVAVFGTANDGGAAALLALAAAFGVPALLGDRIRRFKFGSVEIELIDRATALHRLASEADRAGHHGLAEELRAAARQVVARLSDLGAEYEEIRRRPPSWERTLEQGKFVHKAEQLAKAGRATAELVSRLFPEADLGLRAFLLGMMKGDEKARHFGSVVDAIRHSRSGDEQYHALKVLQMMVGDKILDADQAREIKKLLTELPDKAAYIADSRDRKAVAQGILKALGQADLSPGKRFSAGDVPAGG